MTSFKKLDHRQSTMTLVERSKMLAAKVGKIQKAKIRHRTESGVEPQFLVLLLVLSSCGGDLLTSDIVFRYFKQLVSHVLRFIQKVTLPKLIPGSVNKVSAVENTASLKGKGRESFNTSEMLG
ncbi:uncharacterized protein [Malus domestica]|uniref:uncharacterized protein isoform X2 n=1 Tax=Malus domestica TaxID=3750 RepID=UPI000498794B